MTKAELTKRVTALTETTATRDEKKRLIEELCEEYYQATKREPDSNDLERLADWFLADAVVARGSRRRATSISE